MQTVTNIRCSIALMICSWKKSIEEPTRFRVTNIPSNLDWVLRENLQCMLDKTIRPPLGFSNHVLMSIKCDSITEKNAEDDIINYSFCRGNYSAMK